MNALKITFIGFGEVASIFSDAICKKGAKVCAYDILMDRENGMATLKKRAKNEDISFSALADAISGAAYILSTVTSHVAEEAARYCAAHLKSGQVYVDLNATAPSVKQKISSFIQPSGADFVEGAILGAVGVTGHQTRILTGGPKRSEAAETLTGLGLNVTSYSPEIGKASTFKMLRSVFSKGLEALLLEFLIAGKRAGVQDDLWREIVDLFAHNPFDIVAGNWIKTHATAHERRYHEMKQVRQVLEEIGIEPVLTASTEGFFKRSCELGLQEAFPEKPDTFEAVIEFMENRLQVK
jgi:3-hydroxyisobutyrate dehydrogenase-like beta-hydroxyacid dehydrogenase